MSFLGKVLIRPQISEDNLTKTRLDSATLRSRLQHNLPHTLRCMLSDHRHPNLRVDRLATVSLVLRNTRIRSSEIFFELIRITLPPHWRENTNQHRVVPTSNLWLVQSHHLTPCQESSMLWHSSDKNLRSASARSNQEIVHRLVFQGDILLLSVNVEACLVVSRQD